MAETSSLGCELAFLGCCLLGSSPESHGLALDLEVDDFTTPETRALFEQIHQQLESGDVPDPVVICTVRPDLEAVAFEAASAAHSVISARRYQAEIIRGRVRRDAARRLRQAQVALEDPEKDVAQIMAVLEDQARQLAARATVEKPKRTMIEIMQEVLDPGRFDPGRRVTTGLCDLDHVLGGGLAEGSLTVLAGRPGMGKTTLAANVIRHAIEQGEPVLVDSLEMSEVEIVELLAHSLADTPSSVKSLLTQNLSQQTYDRYERAAEKLRDARLSVVNVPSPRTLRQEVERFKAREKGRLVVVDYLQLMEGDRKRYGSRQEEVADISRRLKLIAMELQCVVIGLSQLSRGVESRTSKRPQLSDLRDSGAVEQDADHVLLMYRHEYYDPANEKTKGKAEVNVAKNRTGPTDRVELVYRANHRRFENSAERF